MRDTGKLTLEEAHYRMSALAAHAAGFKNRGVLREGTPADVLVYDLEELDITPPWVGEPIFDLPGGEWRRVQKAKGYHHILVNGVETFTDGECTGATVANQPITSVTGVAQCSPLWMITKGLLSGPSASSGALALPTNRPMFRIFFWLTIVAIRLRR